MIGRIRGRLISLDEHTILVDVGGVGYEMEVTANTLAALPGVGHDVVVHTHLSVREDAHSLFGFASASERDLFRTLIKINGVGPKLALTLLAGLDVVELARCIRDGDVARLVKLPGIGKKTAERLVVELKDRIEKLVAIPDVARPRAAEPATRLVIEEAERALIQLGFRPAEASRAIGSAYEHGHSTEDVVRIALKRMARQEA
ncbi:MAG TPA: Holliday junction branch migration protein RuvA [Pseudomonadales bacterium]|nr:Holliday junction branch migration protein RuvA [Pseudomonadales bacterium]